MKKLGNLSTRMQILENYRRGLLNAGNFLSRKSKKFKLIFFSIKFFFFNLSIAKSIFRIQVFSSFKIETKLIWFGQFELSTFFFDWVPNNITNQKDCPVFWLNLLAILLKVFFFGKLQKLIYQLHCNKVLCN